MASHQEMEICDMGGSKEVLAVIPVMMIRLFILGGVCITPCISVIAVQFGETLTTGLSSSRIRSFGVHHMGIRMPFMCSPETEAQNIG